MKIDPERLAQEFITLCELASPSRHEGAVCEHLKKCFTGLGADEIIEDNSREQTGSECGNLLVRFRGNVAAEPIMFTCHMDTVPPAEGIRVRREGDLFTSDGNTVLGGDDKSGIVACIEAMRALKDGDQKHRPVEFVFTVCEEVGLLGAKSFDVAQLQAKSGYALDGPGFGELVSQAPAMNQLTIRVSGIAAHAGLHPEWGVNAILLAAKALADAKMPCGRIDEESTVNFGVIQGGTASNIVPDEVVIHGEVRSHNPRKLAALTRTIIDRFTSTARNWTDPTGAARGKPDVKVEVREEFPAMHLADASPVMQRIDAALAGLGHNFPHKAMGGGSDANIFTGHGLPTAVLGTGMTNIHSTDEQIQLRDMVDLTRILLALLTAEDQESGTR